MTDICNLLTEIKSILEIIRDMDMSIVEQSNTLDGKGEIIYMDDFEASPHYDTPHSATAKVRGITKRTGNDSAESQDA